MKTVGLLHKPTAHSDWARWPAQCPRSPLSQLDQGFSDHLKKCGEIMLKITELLDHSTIKVPTI